MSTPAHQAAARAGATAGGNPVQPLEIPYVGYAVGMVGIYQARPANQPNTVLLFVWKHVGHCRDFEHRFRPVGLAGSLVKCVKQSADYVLVEQTIAFRRLLLLTRADHDVDGLPASRANR